MMWNRLRVVFLGFVVSLCLDSLALAQGLQSSPYAAPSLLRGNGMGPAQPDSFDRSYASGNQHGGPESLLAGASSRKDIPNLQTGYTYYSGKRWRVGYVSLDYILPVRLSESSIVFGEAHSELQTFSTKTPPYADDQAYVSLGGGFRTMLRKTTLIGANCFYDATRFADRWLSSGGAGFEMAALLPGHDALDMNFNWYGDLSTSELLVNEFRKGPSNFDLQVGYSHQLFHGGPDLRLSGTAYQFDDGGGVYGWQAGVELKSPDGVLSAKYVTAYDLVNESYQAVSAFINIGFQIENLLRGRNPFVMPEPIFNSPRNFNRLTDKVKRHWRHTTHGVLLAGNNQTITIVNKRSEPVKLHMGINASWGKYSATDFPGFSVDGCNSAGKVLVLNRALNPGDSVVLTFDPGKGLISPAFSVNPASSPNQCTWQCTTSTPQTLAEFTLQGSNGYYPQDIIDVSLVNGFNLPVEIASSRSGVPPIRVDSATGNKNKLGVFPLYCDECNKSTVPGCGFPPDQTECSPNNQCQWWQNPGANYVVSILPN